MIKRLLLTLGLCFWSQSCNSVFAADSAVIQSAVVSASATMTETFSGGVVHGYFRGETVGTRNAFAGVAEVAPGAELHPAHRHEEEEFLLIVEGEGRWTLNGKESVAKTGDMLYAAPGDLHGLFNTGKMPLRFALWKWRAKTTTPPTEPMKSSP